ncbi:MAG TPA: T9SS type A sorting domain-containing protein [Saprospiraceae bacterium]|nr:T9SS type A sorting domain-containing protein [Saprospiraceae bacterium]
MKKICLSILVMLSALMIHAQTTMQGPEYPVITRLEGVGAGENFLELADGEYDKILDKSNYGEVTYKPGAAPIRVEVINPSATKDGKYFITFLDPFPSDTLSLSTRWILLNESGDTLAFADQPIEQFNEQIIADLGISVRIGQSDDAGDNEDTSNGTIGYSLTYSDTVQSPWLSFIPDDYAGVPFINFIQTELPIYHNFFLDPFQAYSNFAPWVPFILTDKIQDEPAENPLGWNLTPGWMDPSASLIASPQFGGVLQSLNNVDIILTSDTSKWSRCVVVETANVYYTGPDYGIGLPTEGNKKSLQPRSKPSVGKYDADNDGYPDPDNNVDDNGFSTGMGWFPGFAVDVESGDRLNIFFGENSVYDDFVGPGLNVGDVAHDMIWNPGKQIILPTGVEFTPIEVFAGGQQYVYVTRTKYDACQGLRRDLDRTGLVKARALANVTWCSIPITIDDPTIDLLPLNEGIIPNDVTIKLRVDNPYQLATGNGQYNEYPTYRFELEGISSTGEPISNASSFFLSPNPATNLITIGTRINWQGNISISIFNTDGIEMLGNKFSNLEKMVMDVSSLIPGMYFVEIRTPEGREIRKLMIQK